MGVPRFGERCDVLYLLTAQSQCTELADRCVQNQVRLQSTAPFGPFLKPPSDGGCCLGAKLMSNNGVAQRVKVGALRLPGSFTLANDFLEQDGVLVA